MDVTIVEYGLGNLGSAQKAIEQSGHTATITSDPRAIREARRVLLPGVGAFGPAIQRLRETGLDEAVTDAARAGKPVLGICLGMHLLMDKSYELGERDGLGLVRGEVVRFPHNGPKVPQIGWNSVTPCGSPLLEDIPEELMFYFVHSYYCQPVDPAVVGGKTHYGVDFCSVLTAGNIHAAQFHPEKSGRAGLLFLKRFAEIPA